jgi:hypothetical protein
VAQTDADRELIELQRSLSASGAGIAGLPSGAAVAADPEVVRTWELRRAAQAEAYGQYVADGDIYIGNALTFTNGQAVPLEHVIRFELEERGQVNRVATPEMARLGRRFETNEEFLTANPNLRRRLQSGRPAGELHPSALDPRGGAAAIDDARKAGKDVAAPTYPGDTSEDRQEAVQVAAEKLPDGSSTTDQSSPKDSDESDADKGSGSKSRRGGRASGSTKED